MKPQMKVLKVTSYKLIVANAKLFRGELRPKKYQKKAHPNQHRTDPVCNFELFCALQIGNNAMTAEI